MLTAPQWRQVIDSASETAIISLDNDACVTSWSRGAERMLETLGGSSTVAVDGDREALHA